ncbi:hypothetical protein E2562_001241 [Oryza meyeriana var. granulata]|uniref:Uncharacterized protein n=1 Tax=Oryza meyeriana var. granulata TaxID=110450 RepID=A0A6G1DC64_9ORYZ|nr:hypothetical protein E2562_001241 [Oryza meyeriana var. granulata]
MAWERPIPEAILSPLLRQRLLDRAISPPPPKLGAAPPPPQPVGETGIREKKTRSNTISYSSMNG